MIGRSGSFVFRVLGFGSNGKVTALGEVLLAFLLAKLHIHFVAVSSQLVGLEHALGLEVLDAMLWDFVLHGGYVEVMQGEISLASGVLLF